MRVFSPSDNGDDGHLRMHHPHQESLIGEWEHEEVKLDSCLLVTTIIMADGLPACQSSHEILICIVSSERRWNVIHSLGGVGLHLLTVGTMRMAGLWSAVASRCGRPVCCMGREFIMISTCSPLHFPNGEEEYNSC